MTAGMLTAPPQPRTLRGAPPEWPADSGGKLLSTRPPATPPPSRW
eukprot:CAMPEP_0185158296 /NCGR_PEP_ID=MMETSP1139-20130426/2327_1 /TAXON_ID=298111 /ORGANISM="Pavlova sp., Strain CCMP459" /LENGTH=44 /DNA_ID= /DNA_START= /DNA_END= /DNA_ORIENTATION=